MSDQIQSIAERIRDLREIAGLSPETLAGEMGVA